MPPAVEVVHLKKAYGPLQAVADIGFTVAPQEIFGLVGPNGAGKTTTVECIEGLRQADGGEVRVLGLDPWRERSRLYRRMGVQFQESSLYDSIRLREALRLFASMFPSPLPGDRLLAEFGLLDRAEAFYGKLSGGQQRKFATALALVGRPELAVLDEPTSGLDPQSRLAFWTVLRRYRAEGLTILLTTHDLQEAAESCDRVCIVDRGRVVALGAPAELVGAERLGTCLTAPLPANGFDRQALAGLPGVRRLKVLEDRLYLFGDGEELLAAAARRLREAGIESFTTRKASLEDLYLILTGRDYQHEDEARS